MAESIARLHERGQWQKRIIKREKGEEQKKENQWTCPQPENKRKQGKRKEESRGSSEENLPCVGRRKPLECCSEQSSKVP